MDELDNSCAFSKRLYVPPTYAELRKIINIAQAEAPAYFRPASLTAFSWHRTFPPPPPLLTSAFEPSRSDIFISRRPAQAHAGARRVKMLTFDADDTLFPGGCSLSQDDWVVEAILTFLRKGAANCTYIFCLCLSHQISCLGLFFDIYALPMILIANSFSHCSLQVWLSPW
jgi:hypothetical protein